MRINCVGLADLLCAYADGELTDANIKLVEDHLAICDNCTSVLKIYREITTSINDTSVEPPPALVTGVMNRVVNESTPRPVKETEQRKRYKFILKRYLPVAACLIVMLFAWQFWGNTLFAGRFDNEATRGSGSMPSASMPAAEPDSIGDGAGAMPPPAAPAGDMVMESMDTDEESGALRRSYNITDDMKISLSEQEMEQFLSFLDSAYAEITITGELPDFLALYEPHNLTTLFDVETIFEIPSTGVQALLDELNNREGSSYIHINNESKYAVVVYTP